MLNKQEQSQIAGDGCVQNQYSNCTINNNSSDPTLIRSIAQEIVSKEMLNVFRICTEDALKIAKQRDEFFASVLIPRLEKVESAVTELREPKFQNMIQQAREVAAQTDRKEDFDMLSELLVHHVENSKDRMCYTAIKQAINIVDQVDLKALCSLTVINGILSYYPTAGTIRKGLEDLNCVFQSFLMEDLPSDRKWMDHLDVLKAIRISTLNLNRLEQIVWARMEGYACVGIKKDSAEHREANEIMDANQISRSYLVANECMDGYLRFSICNMDRVYPEYRDAVSRILNLYEKADYLLGVARKNFVEIWDSYDSLRKIRVWWNAIPAGLELTSVGRALAITNAKRLVPTLPDVKNI